MVASSHVIDERASVRFLLCHDEHPRAAAVARARRGIAGPAAAAVLGLAAAWPAHAQAPDDVIVVGASAEPRSLDPHVATALSDFRIMANLYEGLVRFRPGTLEVGPGLAERWEVSDSGTRYRFHLRDGVRFHDGTPFDAAAVKFNFDRMLDAEHPLHDTGPFPLAFFFDPVREVRTPDAHVVEFVLDKPFAPLLANLAYPTGFVVSPAAVRRHGADYGRHPSGTGAFRFRRWDSGVRVVLEANRDHRDGGPASETLIFRPVLDANTRVAELMAGGLDVLPEAPADVLEHLRRDPAFTVHQQAGPHLWYLILNLRHGPFADRRMRLAVNYAVDKQALAEQLLQGTATPAGGPIPAAFGWANDPSVDPYPHDPARARELIRAAGLGGARLVMLAPSAGSGMLAPVQMATAIQADLEAVGLEVEIRVLEWNAYLAEVNGGLDDGVDMAEMAWMTNNPDTLPYLALRSGAFPDKGGFNSGYYRNSTIDGLIERARRATDRDERAQLYRRIDRLVHEDAPWLFGVSWRQAAVTRAGLQGFALEPSFLLRLADAHKT